MMSIWFRQSAYQYCPLVLLVSLYLVAQLKPQLAPLPCRVELWALGLFALAGFIWILGRAGDVALLRHIALVAMLQMGVLIFLGTKIVKIILFPLGYLIFSIPFGEEIIPSLQLVTAHGAIFLLHLFDVPAFLQGVQISTPNGLYRVAEACAGVHFLMGMLAYGALLSYFFFTTWRRRILWTAACGLVSIVGNAVRAFATIYVGFGTTPQFAGSVDHIIYGWVFFAAIMTVMTLAARPFAQLPAEIRPVTGDGVPVNAEPRLARAAGLCALGVALLIIGLSIWGQAIAQARAPRLTKWVELPQVAGWTRLSPRDETDWLPYYAGADQIRTAHYRAAQGQVVDVVLVLYSKQRDGAELIGHGQGASGAETGSWQWSGYGPHARIAPEAGPARMDVITARNGQRRLVVTRYFVDGALAASNLEVKWRMMRARLLARAPVGAALLISTHLPPGLHDAPMLYAFQAQLGAPETVVRRLIAQAQP